MFDFESELEQYKLENTKIDLTGLDDESRKENFSKIVSPTNSKTEYRWVNMPVIQSDRLWPLSKMAVAKNQNGCCSLNSNPNH